MSAERTFRDGSGTDFELIETLRFEHGRFVRLERHLGRLEASAHALGFTFSPHEIMAALQSLSTGPRLRVRLILAHDGRVRIESAPFTEIAPGAVWRLAVAKQATLRSDDPLLRHKTTRRAVYTAARSEFAPSIADEVLLCNERGEICEGTITNLFADFGDGILLTPPLACGLLAGVLRAELIEEGKAREAVLKPEMLVSAKAIHVGNSLRGLIRARLVDQPYDAGAKA